MTFGDDKAARVRTDVLVEDAGHLDRVAAVDPRAFAPEPQHLRGLTGPLAALDRLVRFPEVCLVAVDLPLRLLRHDAIVSRRGGSSLDFNGFLALRRRRSEERLSGGAWVSTARVVGCASART